MYFSPQKQKFIDAAVEMFGDGVVLDKQGVRDASAKAGVPLAGWFMKSYKVGYNQFKLPSETQVLFRLMWYLNQRLRPQ